MWLVIISCLVYSLANFSSATIDNRPSHDAQSCLTVGDQCHANSDCCSHLTCSPVQGEFEHCPVADVHSVFWLGKNLCLPSTYDERLQRRADDVIMPPYYNTNNQFYPYALSKLRLPPTKGQTSKQASSAAKRLGNGSTKTIRVHFLFLYSCLEWDHCQFHEDCGEGNCCYVHFRFRSLPKWFCRPNRNDQDEPCEPLTKYRSPKVMPAQKQQQR